MFASSGTSLEKLASLNVQQVCGFKRRPRPPEFDLAGDLAQVEIFHPLGAFAEIPFESLEKIAGPVEDDELSTGVENPVYGRAFREPWQDFGEERLVRVRNRGELEVQATFR